MERFGRVTSYAVVAVGWGLQNSDRKAGARTSACVRAGDRGLLKPLDTLPRIPFNQKEVKVEKCPRCGEYFRGTTCPVCTLDTADSGPWVIGKVIGAALQDGNFGKLRLQDLEESCRNNGLKCGDHRLLVYVYRSLRDESGWIRWHRLLEWVAHGDHNMRMTARQILSVCAPELLCH